MIRKVVPLILALMGTGGGVAAGMWLSPAARDDRAAVPEGNTGPREDRKAAEAALDTEFVKLDNQFVIPIVQSDMISAMVVMSLSVEITQGNTQHVYEREPKLRDAFLQVLFDHANMGGFAGEFTDSNTMDVLRVALTEKAERVLGDVVRGVLITGVARQDL
jgi:hypothetical protein